MRILRFNASGLRNLSQLEFTPHESVNIIYGDNAQGKTNLLEGMWLFTGLRSFRGAKDAELIAKNADICSMGIDYFCGGREQNAKIVIAGNGKKAEQNGVALKTRSALAGGLCAVVFSPVHLSLIKDGPAVRRRFTDGALCQIKPAYTAVLSKYTHALTQRNALLHDCARHSQLLDMLDMWNSELCREGARIMLLRKKYTERLCTEAAEFYGGISGGKERLCVSYAPSFECDEGEIAAEFMRRLKENYREDIKNGTTGVGPHRDNLVFAINGMDARAFGSQGQQRSCVLALKLAEAALASRVTGEQPVALLDDVMSELDTGRQDYLLNRMTGWQVFITCCDPAPILRLSSGSCFCMREGVLTESSDVRTVV